MRLLTLLATTLLLAACVHDTDDTSFFLTESGASLTYYIGSGGGADQKNHDDPWDTIGENFADESIHVAKQGDHDDPWGTIAEKFGNESVHVSKRGDREDPWDTIAEKFGDESVHVSKRGDREDPWDTIAEKFGDGSTHTGKDLGDDDPWDTINEKFGTETVHTGKVRSRRAANQIDPWDTITDKFGPETEHTGKTDNRHFLGFEKSSAVFVSFGYEEPAADRARIVEVRGRILKLEFADGAEQYVVDAPATWIEGVQLETGFLEATSKKDRPFLGVRVWRTVQGANWGPVSSNLVSDLPTTWPRERSTSGASLLVGLEARQKDWGDPWNRVNELFAAKDGDSDDPWNTIKSNFSEESVHVKNDDDPWDTITDSFGLESIHTGSGKAHDDPWNRINDLFPRESVNTGEGKATSFMGKRLVEVLFVSIGSEKGGEDDPWDRIDNLFPTEKSGGILLKLVEVRGRVGRFVAATGQSVFAVAIPTEWEPGLVIRGKAYLLDTKKVLPLMGAVVWEVDRNLPLPLPLPKAY